MAPDLQDHEPKAWYFKFEPGPEAPSGICSTPLMGDVESGRVYEVTNPQTATVLEDHPEWQSVTKKAYEAQSRADLKESADEK